MATELVVVWNPASGKAEAAASVRNELRNRSRTTVIDAQDPADIATRVQSAAEEGAERIYIAGGDGTVSAALGGLMKSGRSLPLGVIPIGTGNDLCRSLRIPLDPGEAVAMLDSGSPRTIDIIEMANGVETLFYVNMASAGNSDRVIDELTDEQKQWWGPLSYLRGALDVARDLDTYRIKVTDENDAVEEFDIWNVMLANGATSGGGIAVAPEARVDDGKIDLIVVKSGTVPNLVEASVRLFTETLLESDIVERRRSTRFRIESEPPLRFTADGDLVEWVPVTFRIHPKAVFMLTGTENRSEAASTNGDSCPQSPPK